MPSPECLSPDRLPDRGGHLSGAAPARRVALGPSLGRYREALAKRLGPEWVVDHWISAQAAPESEGIIVVLGTAEMALGETTLGRRGRAASLVIGTAPAARAGGNGWAALPDLIADAIRRVATQVTPERV